MPKRLLITGASGLLGFQVARRALQSAWEVVGTISRHRCPLPIEQPQLDLASEDLSGLAAFVGQYRPDALVHCAAMSEAAQCEANPTAALRVNVAATEALALAADRIGCRFVFISTDLVFDGRGAPYCEESLPSPLGCYGRTKMAAEERVLKLGGGGALVLRTSLLLGPSPSGARSVEERLAAQLAAGKQANLFTDEFRSPVYAPDLAVALLELVEAGQSGLLHLGGPERLSRYALGMLLADHFGWDTRLILAASGRDYPSTPPRPSDVSLDSRRAYALLSTPPRSLGQVFAPRNR
ncbi:dTDP-4-dehydrorhamnose reductase family protein [Gloeobacter morelensis]|uniref:SDR family oxidoreductase n=1 Tax=Gloeobacter morelensis MG652769 TaxID=2781736 RepID=A0ABY3PQS7_9CYAN|nr:SDR family oxidoreductase [Gloeobacter morelensis]UFP96038.1 SDR family oxidoreductase [Gloeobacter morelensis MG652769]